MVCFFLFSLFFWAFGGGGGRDARLPAFLFVVITTTTPFFPFPPVLVVGIFLNVVNEAIACAWVMKGIILVAMNYGGQTALDSIFPFLLRICCQLPHLLHPQCGGRGAPREYLRNGNRVGSSYDIWCNSGKRQIPRHKYRSMRAC